MVDAGILRERDRVELIRGEVFTMSPIGTAHVAAVNRATRALIMKAGDAAIVSIQNTIVLDDFTAPEPDVVLMKPREDFYASKHAGPDDIMLIVEMADSSLAYDSRIKAGLYAESGIAEYWIVDIQSNRVLVFSASDGKRYMTARELHRGDKIAPGLLPHCEIDAADLLP